MTPRQVRAALATRTMAAAGLLECVTFSFMDHATAALFGGVDPALRLSNPIASDLDQMRPTPVATLATAAAQNAARGLPDSLLCETGPAFPSTSQEKVAAGLLAGHTGRNPTAPARPIARKTPKQPPNPSYRPSPSPREPLPSPGRPAWYHPGQSGVIRQGPKLILATFGALHPTVTAALDLPTAAAFEVFLDRIPEPKRRKRPTPDLPPFQPVRRDFAFLVEISIPAEPSSAPPAPRTAPSSPKATSSTSSKAPPSPKAKSPLAIEVVLQPRDHTLTDAEIEATAAKVIAAVQKATNATLR